MLITQIQFPFYPNCEIDLRWQGKKLRLFKMVQLCVQHPT
jgi:hypothetical protein